MVKIVLVKYNVDRSIQLRFIRPSNVVINYAGPNKKLMGNYNYKKPISQVTWKRIINGNFFRNRFPLRIQVQ